MEIERKAIFSPSGEKTGDSTRKFGDSKYKSDEGDNKTLTPAFPIYGSIPINPYKFSEALTDTSFPAGETVNPPKGSIDHTGSSS